MAIRNNNESDAIIDEICFTGDGNGFILSTNNGQGNYVNVYGIK